MRGFSPTERKLMRNVYLDSFYRKEKDPLKPKQPISAFFLFTNERRAALLAESKSILEIAKITGEEWKNMSEKQKAPYEEVSFNFTTKPK